MWDDRPSPEQREQLAERLRCVLPPPRPGAPGDSAALAPELAAVSPAQAAEALRRRPGFLWLDGGPDGHRLFARPLVTLQVRGRQARVARPRRGGATGRGGASDAFPARGFDLLEAALHAWGGTGESRAFLVGYLGHELGGELEKLPRPPADDLRLPDLHLALYDRALRWDGRAWFLEHTAAWREEGTASGAAAEAETLLRSARRRALPSPEEIAPGPVTSRPDGAGFAAAVRRTVERIHRGEICQTNLCRRLEAELPAASLWPFYHRLRAASPAVYGAWMDLGRGRAVMSVSPELFLSSRGGLVESRPIKGTRPRGEDPKADHALARELTESAKDRAELAMIVDVTRNDLGRVAVTGSVQVARHAEVISLPTVHHTVSTVRCQLKPGCGAAELLRASFPAASISGAPKIQAMAIAAAEEQRRRGPAMGAFGWIALSGDLELAVAIRTATAAGGKVAYHAGCGIVADSKPEEELEESRVKARAFLTALGARETSEQD